MKVILTRHAQTKENENGLLQGPTTGDFTAEGEKQLKLLAKRLKPFKFGVVYSSDLKRCVKTTEYLFPKAPKIKLLPTLREKNNGEFVGRRARDIDWDSLPGTFESRRLPDGESLEDVRRRGCEFLNILKKGKVETVLVVGHGAFLKVFVGIVLGLDLRRSIFSLQIDHCSLTTVEFNDDGTVKLVSLNDTGYLLHNINKESAKWLE